MSNIRYIMDFSDKDMRQFRTRAKGTLFVGPLQGKGYDNKVQRVTFQELEFKNSMEADKFMDVRTKKYADRNQLKSVKALGFVSRSDEI